jgi:spermidine synthase
MISFSGWKIIYQGSSPISGDFRVEKNGDVVRLVVGGYVQSISANYSGIKDTVWGNIASISSDLVPKTGNCLILGVAGGTIPHLLLKQNPNLAITGVDYDKIITDTGFKFINNQKETDTIKAFNIITADAYKFVLSNKAKYDIIIVDLYTGGKFNPIFESAEFIGSLSRSINPMGTVIINRIFISNIANSIRIFAMDLERFFNKVETKKVRVKFYETSYNTLFVCRL